MTPMTQFSITDLQLVVMRLLLQKIEVLRRGVNHKGGLWKIHCNAHFIVNGIHICIKSIYCIKSHVGKGKSSVISKVLWKGKELLLLVSIMSLKNAEEIELKHCYKKSYPSFTNPEDTWSPVWEETFSLSSHLGLLLPTGLWVRDPDSP